MTDQPLKRKGEHTESELVEFVNKRCYRSSPLYAEDFSTFRKAELYDQCEQWNRRAHTTSDSRYASQWKRMSFAEGDPNAIPLPVYNEGVSIRENESARLGRPEYKPRVRPMSENPGITEKEGALGAERALLSRLGEMPWDVEEDQLTFNMPVYGGAWLLSWWDQTWLETVRVPAPSVACPRHPNLQQGEEAAPEPPMAGPPGLPPSLPPAPPTEGFTPEAPAEAQLAPPVPAECTFATPMTTAPEDNRCPLCPDHPELVPYSPSLEEAQGELGVDVPKGDWFMRILPPYGMYPRDGGVGVNRTDIDECVWIHRETLDWVTERWPSKIRDEGGKLRIRPENPATLMADDPLLGSPDLFGYVESSGILNNSVIVKDYFCRPKLQWDEEAQRYTQDLGRHITIVQKTAVRDDDLLIESLNQPGTFVPRLRLEFIPWELKEGGRRSTVGQSLWDRLFDPQDGVNERKSQTRAVNQRGAVPFYLERKGANLEGVEADVAIPLRRIRANIDPEDRFPPLTLVNNTTIDPGAYNEINDDRSTLERISGNVEVEKGQVPTGVSAATAIAYLKTESGEKRRSRIRRIRQALVRGWQHGLRLMAARYIEPRPYSYEDEAGEQRWAFIHGQVIAKANPQVDIYPTPDYDITEARRESVRDMVQLGIINPTQTPQLNRKIVRALDDSVELFLDDDQQEDQAKREWRAFKEDGKVPVIDPSLDDPMTHYQEHGRQCFSAWYRQKEEDAGWDNVLGIIGASWNQSLARIAMLSLQMAGQPGVSLQTMIYNFWVTSLQQVQFEPPDGEALEVCLQWRAHMEAHKLEVLVAQMGGGSQVQAPGRGSAPTPQSEEESEVTGGGGPEASPEPQSVQ